MMNLYEIGLVTALFLWGMTVFGCIAAALQFYQGNYASAATLLIFSLGYVPLGVIFLP